MTRSTAPRGSRWQLFYRWIEKIPEGRVATYGQIAALAGFARNARQVGYALAALPDDSAVPWQRVVNAKGEVSLRSADDIGRSGYQRHLLEEEGVPFGLDGRIDLERFGWKPRARRPPAEAPERSRKRGAR